MDFLKNFHRRKSNMYFFIFLGFIALLTILHLWDRMIDPRLIIPLLAYVTSPPRDRIFRMLFSILQVLLVIEIYRCELLFR